MSAFLWRIYSIFHLQQEQKKIVTQSACNKSERDMRSVIHIKSVTAMVLSLCLWVDYSLYWFNEYTALLVAWFEYLYLSMNQAFTLLVNRLFNYIKIILFISMSYFCISHRKLYVNWNWIEQGSKIPKNRLGQLNA